MPEPATLSMMLGGVALSGLGAIRRRKRKAA
ncbi:MAG: PEP-CTERM sorting domain-containing protein [Steroidobacteraceae bacterium]